MKNLISALSVFNFKKNFAKNSKENSLINKENSVHYRRDLDSLGWFINFDFPLPEPPNPSQKKTYYPSKNG